MDWGPLIATHSCVADATSTQQSNDHHSQEITPDWMPESHFVNQSLMALHGYHADRPFWHLHSSDALTLPSYAETRTPWRRQENPWHISKMFHATIKIGINVIAPTFQSRCVTGNATAVCWWCKGRDGMLPNRKGSRKLRHRALMLHHDLISGKSVAAILNQLNSSTPIDWHSKLQSTVAETATFGSECVATRTFTEQVIDLRLTLRYLGAPINGATMVRFHPWFSPRMRVVSWVLDPKGSPVLLRRLPPRNATNCLTVAVYNKSTKGESNSFLHRTLLPQHTSHPELVVTQIIFLICCCWRSVDLACVIGFCRHPLASQSLTLQNTQAAPKR